MLGLPLEMVHGSTRLGLIYAAGVLAGSLSTSVLDPGVCLVGASGGVYSLLAGHTANIVTNFSNTRYGGTRLVATLAVASLEVSKYIYLDTCVMVIEIRTSTLIFLNILTANIQYIESQTRF